MSCYPELFGRKSEINMKMKTHSEVTRFHKGSGIVTHKVSYFEICHKNFWQKTPPYVWFSPRKMQHNYSSVRSVCSSWSTGSLCYQFCHATGKDTFISQNSDPNTTKIMTKSH